MQNRMIHYKIVIKITKSVMRICCNFKKSLLMTGLYEILFNLSRNFYKDTEFNVFEIVNRQQKTR